MSLYECQQRRTKLDDDTTCGLRCNVFPDCVPFTNEQGRALPTHLRRIPTGPRQATAYDVDCCPPGPQDL
jgi:hypothetical protein